MRKCLFPVYRLAVDARPVGWWWSGLKISELAQGFSDGYAINGSQRHLHQPQGVYLGFCQSIQPRAMSAENDLFLRLQRRQRDKREKKENGRMSRYISWRVNGLIDFHRICFLCQDSVGIGTIRNSWIIDMLDSSTPVVQNLIIS